MGKLTRTLVIPLTIISFTVISKWWYVNPVDARLSMMGGFPLIWISEGWHTSLSLMIFVKELLINLVVYFTACFALVYMVNRYMWTVKIPKAMKIGLIIVASTILIFMGLIGSMSEHIYKWERDFEIEVVTTGYNFFWSKPERPDYKEFRNQ